MSKQYSIAQARDNLAAIVHELEKSKSIEITRRGQPVAVLISKQEYDRMQTYTTGFWDAYKSFAKEVNLVELSIAGHPACSGACVIAPPGERLSCDAQISVRHQCHFRTIETSPKSWHHAPP